jgi:hypothetical protein
MRRYQCTAIIIRRETKPGESGLWRLGQGDDALAQPALVVRKLQVPYHPLLSAPRERLAAGASLVVPGESLDAISSPAVCAVNAGHEWLGMRRDRRCLRNSPSGRTPAMCRCLTLVRLQPWAAAREAALARLRARRRSGRPCRAHRDGRVASFIAATVRGRHVTP